MKAKKLIKESLLATILVFVMLFLLFQLIHISFKPFNYVAKTIKEINLNDLYFSGLNNNTVDTNIVIINVEDLDRKGITNVLNKTSKGNPAVIGLDVFFSEQKHTEDDSLLRATLNALNDKLVLAKSYNQQKKPDTDYWQLDGLKSGHSGILTNKNNTEVVRFFEPYIITNQTKIWSFSSVIVETFNNSSFQKLEKRKIPTEMLNYTGDKNAFREINYRDLLAYDENELSQLNNKIVLLGFCGGNTQNTSDYNDMFYTPVGFDMSPNRRPDMYGVVLHANIISMLLKDNYINKVSTWFTIIIVLLITFLHVMLFTYFYVKQHLYYHVVAKLAQLLSFSLILWVVFLLFSYWQVYFPAKYMLLPVILSVDVLYLYEALAVLLYKKFKINSIFVHEH